MKVSNVSEMRACDKAAIVQFGIPELLLMENAGLASYEVLLSRCGVANKAFVVLAGMGNNGGDGFVVARKIISGGGSVKVFILGDAKKYAGSALINLEIIRKMSIEIIEVSTVRAIRKDIAGCDVIIDAIFGTGLAREVEDLHKKIIKEINSSKKIIVSLDIPSGINGDTGQVMGHAVRADYTVTFGLPKIGNLLMPGFHHCGMLFVSHISFPPSLYDSETLKIALNDPLSLQSRNPDGHKGEFGEALFIAGAKRYYGAPHFAALSFMKAGGGYSRLATPESITPSIASMGSEIVFLPQKETSSGSISLANKARLLDISDKMDFVVLGPGLSLNEETSTLIRELARSIKKPLLIDGDGITAICKDLTCIRKRKAPTILTPHLGEMGRITGIPVKNMDIDRIGTLRKTANQLGAIIVLKGAHSLIGCPDGKVFVNLSGNPGMATAGSGDVLTGTIAAMYGLGLSVEDAACKGVFIHGASGDLAAQEIGEDGLTAQDILNYLPRTMVLDRKGALAEQYALPIVL